MREIPPHAPVIILRPLEIPGDKTPGVEPDAVGQQKAAQERQRHQHEKNLQRHLFIAVQDCCRFSQSHDHKHVNGRADRRQRLVEHEAGGIDLALEAAVPEQRPPHQRQRHEQHVRVHILERKCGGAKQQLLAAGIDSDNE